MIPRSCVIRVLPAAAVSPVRILPIRVDPGWRGGAGGAGWDGRRGAEPLGYVYGRSGVLGGLGRAGAGSGMTCSPFTGRGGRRVAGRRCDGGRDTPAGGGCTALPDADKSGCQLLAGAARRCCDHRRPAGGHLPGAGHAYRMTAPAVAGRRHLEVTGAEDVHRVTAAASAAAMPGIWPGSSQQAPTASAGYAALRAP
jgi:hypothetical protein